MGPRASDAVRGSGTDAGIRAGRTPPLHRRVRAAVVHRFTVDPRALAALRISLGLLLLADLLIRSGDLVVFYTDEGVLPRSVLRDQYGAVATLAFAHGLSGAAWVQGVLFALAGVIAIALGVGYRTRLATLGSFLLLVSLYARNPVLLNAGDTLLLFLLLWGLFLPLGGRWSMDAARGRPRRTPVASVATVAVLVQVVIVYAVNGIVKLRGEAWVSGEAIRLVFELDHLTVRLGDALAGYPRLLEALGWIWLAMLLTSVLLIVLPGWPRAAFAGSFIGMHLGMFLTMRLGLFPFVSIAALLPFLPPRLWEVASERIGPRLPRWSHGGRWLERPPRESTRHISVAVPDDYREYARLAAQVVVAVLLVLVLVWNAASLGYVTTPNGVSAAVSPEERRWDMFAPDPRRNDGWYVVPGELASGETVDAFHGGPIRWDRPPELARAFPSHRWFVYLLELPRPGTETLRGAFADYLCRRWNANHEDRLEAVTLVYVMEPARLDATVRHERVTLGRYGCSSA